MTSSKQVTDRQKSATMVVAAGQTHAARIQEAVVRLLEPHLERKQNVPDVGSFLLLSMKALERARDKMVLADEAHIRELSDDQVHREVREEAAAALYEQIVEFREILVGLYGKRVPAMFGLEGPTERDAVALSRQASLLVESFKKKPKLPSTRVRGAKIDLDEWADELTNKKARLDAALDHVAREKREAEATLAAKTSAIQTYDELFSWTADLTSALLQMSGEAALAARVRPSGRRPGRVFDSEDSEPKAAEAADSRTGSSESDA